MVNTQPPSKGSIQLIWGIALILAGVGMFVYIPQRTAELAQSSSFFGNIMVARICLYLMAVILVGGGAKKVVRYFKYKPSGTTQGAGDENR